jgi:hypothetical protein
VSGEGESAGEATLSFFGVTEAYRRRLIHAKDLGHGRRNVCLTAKNAKKNGEKAG